MSEQAQPNFMTKAFEKISKGTIDPTLFQHKGVGNEGQDNVALTPLIINGVEVKLHESDLTTYWRWLKKQKRHRKSKKRKKKKRMKNLKEKRNKREGG